MAPQEDSMVVTSCAPVTQTHRAQLRRSSLPGQHERLSSATRGWRRTMPPASTSVLVRPTRYLSADQLLYRKL